MPSKKVVLTVLVACTASRYFLTLLLGSWCLILAGPVLAQDEADLAKASQNPVGSLISLPFQNNTSFGIGPTDAMSNVLNIQPVYPVPLSKDWNLVNRGIIPIIYQQEIVPGSGSTSGLGDISYTAFVAPAEAGKLIWGVGPAFTLPAASDDAFASDKWSVGPGVVVMTMPGNFVLGALMQNVWSFAGDSAAADVNEGFIQLILNYNMKQGWYLTSVPVITVDWEADSDNRWTVPVGGGVGKITRLGAQPLDVQMQAFYNVKKPDGGADWSLRLQFKLLFPK